MNGDYHGYGIYRWANGGVYYGEWKEGNHDGRGYQRRADGNEYCGEWKNHMPHGEGVLKENGQLYRVKYDEGTIISRSELAKDVNQK